MLLIVIQKRKNRKNCRKNVLEKARRGGLKGTIGGNDLQQRKTVNSQ